MVVVGKLVKKKQGLYRRMFINMEICHQWNTTGIRYWSHLAPYLYQRSGPWSGKVLGRIKRYSPVRLYQVNCSSSCRSQRALHRRYRNFVTVNVKSQVDGQLVSKAKLTVALTLTLILTRTS